MGILGEFHFQVNILMVGLIVWLVGLVGWLVGVDSVGWDACDQSCSASVGE